MWDSFLPKKKLMKLRQRPYKRRSNIDTQPKWYKAVSCTLGSKLPGSQDKKGNTINYKHARSLKNQCNKCGLFWSQGLREQSPKGPEGGDTVQHKRAATLKGRALFRRSGVGPRNQHFHKAPWWPGRTLWCGDWRGWDDRWPRPPHFLLYEHRQGTALSWASYLHPKNRTINNSYPRELSQGSKEVMCLKHLAGSWYTEDTK